MACFESLNTMLIYILCKYAEKSSLQLGVLRGEWNSVPAEINSCSASEGSLGKISYLSMETEDAFFDFTKLQKFRKLCIKIISALILEFQGIYFV